MNEKLKIEKNLGRTYIKRFFGLLKKRKGYHFLNAIDLLAYFIQLHYIDECVLVILDCKKAFSGLPKLNILKRDDYDSYLMGFENDYVIIEFANIAAAKDYAYSFPMDLKLPYLIFDNGKLAHSETFEKQSIER